MVDSKEKCRSWFIVWNNPQEYFVDMKPEEMAESALDIWMQEHSSRSGAVAYCISAEGLIHFHMVLCDDNQSRFATVKSLYPKAHIEPTRGTKDQAEDYINKRGKYVEKGEIVVYIAKRGELKANKGSRKDFEIIQDMIESGKKPREIMSCNFAYRRYSKQITDAYFEKRFNETPRIRDVNVIYHVGASGSGKSYSIASLAENCGDDNIYRCTDYENGGFDFYQGETILVLEEFRGQFKYNYLLNLLDVYKTQIHCRYLNGYALWNEVHIVTVYPPEVLYSKMVGENKDVDTRKQLYRRIRTIVYHWNDHDSYHEYTLPFGEYTNYSNLINRATGSEFIEISEDEQMEIPFI